MTAKETTSIWTVTETQGEDMTILGAYSTEERANREVEALRKLYDHEYEVEMFTLDWDSWLENDNLKGGK